MEEENFSEKIFNPKSSSQNHITNLANLNNLEIPPLLLEFH
jgi:hypothetical protein